MMKIRTFMGDDQNLDDAIESAESAAQVLLDSLASDELVSVQAQTIIDQWVCTHVITVVYAQR